MIALPKPEACCGCGACADACPAGCIELLPDAEGFLRPTVNAAECLGCGACAAACPVLMPPAKGGVIASYAVVNGNREELMNSSSGGAFALLARGVLAKGGAVCGAAFGPGLEVCHRFIEKEEDLPLIMGSKYSQSRTVGVFEKTREYLEQGRPVLFSGTPCQTAALESFLGRGYEGLLVCDVVCHGVPSPLHWRKYLDSVTKSHGRPVSAAFRDKSSGWRHYSVTVKTEGGKTLSAPASAHPHMRPFLKNLILRPSCYECRFRGLARHSDLTLADLWGAEKVLGAADGDTGVSLVMTHTQKGEEAIASLTGAKVTRVDTDLALSFNASALRSPEKPPARAAYMAELPAGDIAALNKKYCADSALVRLKGAVKRLIGR